VAIFGDLEKLVDLFLAELPEGMFAEDRADHPDPSKRSISSSDIRAQMKLLADAYVNMARIYDDKFPHLIGLEAARRWEKMVFPDPVDASRPLNERITDITTKLRLIGGISFLTIQSLVDTILGAEGLDYEIVNWSGLNGGAWLFEESLLDVDTYLTLTDPILGKQVGQELDCDLDYQAAGLTLDQLIGIQRTAYTYEVRIKGNATLAVIARLDRELTKFEPARSTHIITNNFIGLDLDETIDGGFFGQPYTRVIDGRDFSDFSLDRVYDGGVF
jgi:hypothetical protein